MNESIRTARAKFIARLTLNDFFTGKPAHDRRQSHARVHCAHIHAADFWQVTDDGDAIDRHWPKSDTLNPGSRVSRRRYALIAAPRKSAIGSGSGREGLIHANEVPVTPEAIPSASTTLTSAPLAAR